MPTVLLHRVDVTGARADLDAVSADAGWHLLEHLAVYSMATSASVGGMSYRYDDDYKRPGPDVESFARRYPQVQFVHECVDEFGDVGFRDAYLGGELKSSERVDPRRFVWVTWET